MEIRISTISFAKKKAKINREREIFVKGLLDELYEKICLSDDLLNVEQELKQYDNLKKELQQMYEAKGEEASSEPNVAGLKKVSDLQSFS